MFPLKCSARIFYCQYQSRIFCHSGVYFISYKAFGYRERHLGWVSVWMED
ncbi:hypothetical protein DsansV1_C35g0230011 [Dioscorea sansibarensis]